jgi:hypothetical protein
MRKTIFTFLLCLMALMVSLAQDTNYPVPTLSLTEADTLPNDSLIISEVVVYNAGNYGYAEFTNTSSKVIDMANFFIQGRFQNNGGPFVGNMTKKNLRGLLNPGESYVVAVGYNRSKELDEEGNQVFLNGIAGNLAVMYQLADTFFTDLSLQQANSVTLFSRYKNKISGFVDSANVDVFNSDLKVLKNNTSNEPIAGLVLNGNPVWNVWIRNPIIRKGETNWDNSRGNDLKDSEWYYLPIHQMRHVNGFPFTTVGVHKKSETLAVAPKEGVVIDMDNKVIKLPYGTRRDSLFRNMFSYGENVAWDLKMGADSSQFYVQEDDTIHFYILNDSLIDLTFTVNVEPKPTTFAKVSPRLIKNANGLYTYRYTYSNGVEPIDTIGNIPFDTRLDTLLNYIIIEEGNSYEIIYANGQVNPDLKYGDILRITTPENTKKDYKLCIKKYSEDFLANLKHIIFPGLELWENPKTFLYSDTFLLFNSNAKEFFIELPIGTENSPGMVAVPEFPNTRISYTPAANLVGSLQERTATITAISENKKDTLVYSFIYNVKRDEPALDYSPFICDIGSDWTIGTFSIIQLFNPSDEQVDLTDYMMLLNKSN